jgi:hypothetical protein
MTDIDQQLASILNEYVGCTSPYCFIHKADKAMWSSRAFDMTYNRVVNSVVEHAGPMRRYLDKAAKFAIQSPDFEVVHGVCYRPDDVNVPDGKFNMAIDPLIKELNERPEIFLAHMNYLIPNRTERMLLVSWLAWIVQHPDQKVMYAVLIVGKGGTGKSWLGKLMERIFGEDNVVLISEEDAVTSTFNGFSENKRFVFLHETPPDKMVELMHKVRGLITESHIHVNRKGIERYKAENLANLMAISNEEIPVEVTNRRVAVVRANDDVYGTDDRGQTTKECKEYYERLWSVVPQDGTVTDEARRVLRYLRHFPLDKVGFDRTMPPLTGTKETMARVGEGKVYGNIADDYKDRKGPLQYTLITTEEIAKHLGVSNDKTLTKAMEDAGCRKLRGANGRDVQVYLNDGRPRLWAISKKVAAEMVGMSNEELVSLYKAERAGGKGYTKAMDEEVAAADFV